MAKTVDYYINAVMDNPEYCTLFYENPSVNPITGFYVEENKDTYTKLKTACDFYIREILGGEPPIPAKVEEITPLVPTSNLAKSKIPSPSSIGKSLPPTTTMLPPPMLTTTSSLRQLPVRQLQPSTTSLGQLPPSLRQLPLRQLRPSTSTLPPPITNTLPPPLTKTVILPPITTPLQPITIPLQPITTPLQPITTPLQPITRKVSPLAKTIVLPPSTRRLVPLPTLLTRTARRPPSPKSIVGIRSIPKVELGRKTYTENIGPRLSGLPSEAIINICKGMNIKELKSFVETSSKNMELCHNILKEKVVKEQKNKIKTLIDNRLNDMYPGFVLDISNYDTIDPDKDEIGIYLIKPTFNLVPVFDASVKLYIDKTKLNRMKRLLEIK
jgi:hypothetical protein